MKELDERIQALVKKEVIIMADSLFDHVESLKDILKVNDKSHTYSQPTISTSLKNKDLSPYIKKPSKQYNWQGKFNTSKSFN